MSRKIEREIEIAATPEQVWEALATGEGIKSWFAPDARVTPGAGGRLYLSWGPGFEGESPIQAWDPPRHFGTLEASRPIAHDYFVEARGGRTLVRVVDSGFGDGAEWDNEIESLKKGWEVFLRNLRFYLEHHAGKRCRQVQMMRKLELSPEAAWPRLTGERWLGLPAGGAAPYQARTASGDALRGTIELWQPPHTLAATVDNLDARLNIAVEGMGDKVFLFATLLVYGREDAEIDALAARWNASLDRALEAS